MTPYGFSHSDMHDSKLNFCKLNMLTRQKNGFILPFSPAAMTQWVRGDDELESTHVQKSIRLTSEGKFVVSL